MLFPTSLVPDASSFVRQGQSTAWTKEENKLFESALAVFDENTPNRWYMVASMIPGKSVYDVMNQYRELEADVCDIEAGLVPVPGYLASSFTLELEDHRGFDVYRKRSRCYDREHKKGVPWTEEEHRRFLIGLQKHGKGDWRNISRNFVISKSPTQVASHAQKYYLRQLSGGKDKRRPSIHDIHLNNVSQTNNDKPRLSDEPTYLVPFHKPTNAPKLLLDWTRDNDGALMVFNSTSGDSSLAYPRDIASKSRYLVSAGGYGEAMHIQSPRFLS